MDPTVSLIIYIYGVYGYKYLIPHLEIPSSALPLSSLSWIDPVYHRLALCNASSYILFILSFIIYYLLLWLLEENGVPIHTACNKQIHALTLSASHQFPNRKHPARRSLGLPAAGGTGQQALSCGEIAFRSHGPCAPLQGRSLGSPPE